MYLNLVYFLEEIIELKLEILSIYPKLSISLQSYAVNKLIFFQEFCLAGESDIFWDLDWRSVSGKIVISHANYQVKTAELVLKKLFWKF